MRSDKCYSLVVVSWISACFFRYHKLGTGFNPNTLDKQKERQKGLPKQVFEADEMPDNSSYQDDQVPKEIFNFINIKTCPCQLELLQHYFVTLSHPVGRHEAKIDVYRWHPAWQLGLQHIRLEELPPGRPSPSPARPCSQWGDWQTEWRAAQGQPSPRIVCFAPCPRRGELFSSICLFRFLFFYSCVLFSVNVQEEPIERHCVPEVPKEHFGQRLLVKCLSLK